MHLRLSFVHFVKKKNFQYRKCLATVSSATYTCFQWTGDGQCFQIQYLTLDTWPGSPIVEWKIKCLGENEKKQTITISKAAWNYEKEIIIDLINQAIQDFRVKYQESSIGFENLAYLQSIEKKCKYC